MFVCEWLGGHFGFGNVWHYPLIVAIDSKEDEENVPPPPKLASRQKKILWGHLKARWVQGSYFFIMMAMTKTTIWNEDEKRSLGKILVGPIWSMMNLKGDCD